MFCDTLQGAVQIPQAQAPTELQRVRARCLLSLWPADRLSGAPPQLQLLSQSSSHNSKLPHQVPYLLQRRFRVRQFEAV